MELPNESEARTYRLPIGYRFDPTDEVLTGYYLRKKILSQPLPHNLVPECDVFQTEPWRLQGGERYLNWQKFFFYDPKDRVFENPQKIGAGNGEWRGVERGQQIELSGKEVIAKRNTYVFWEGNGDNFTRTNWLMNEFHLILKSNPTMRSGMGIYRIFEVEGRRRKKARVSREGASTNGNSGEVIDAVPTVIDLTETCGSVGDTPPPGSPC
ncbi:NAC domain-containing protein 41 isoform X2 [Cajanus cajan]|uniref:NAC domain-containing protein 7 n=1 Tax=Cajanus cajan TaxID=3821 RepID=A0A151SM40_CAJCA|nr:NAC domain-containing protein 41 isoform X2 [Cajanus cajan]KYP55877.1 NAC domain-containing protein 7 [Cajanus cajan]